MTAPVVTFKILPPGAPLRCRWPMVTAINAPLRAGLSRKGARFTLTIDPSGEVGAIRPA